MSDQKKFEVIIAGAGVVGLFLACELGLQGISVLVLERDANASSPRKVLPLGIRGLQNPALEALYRRGLLSKICSDKEKNDAALLYRLEKEAVEGSGRPRAAQGETSKASASAQQKHSIFGEHFMPDSARRTQEGEKPYMFGGHFAGLPLNAAVLDLSHFPYKLPGPSLVPVTASIASMEQVLAERAEQLGVTILRGRAVSQILYPDPETVTVVAGPENSEYSAQWLVGCDGGQSAVRKLADFNTVGTEPKTTIYILHCTLEDPSKIQTGFHITSSGMAMSAVPGVFHLIDFDDGAFDRSQKLGFEQAQETLQRIAETDARIKDLGDVWTATDRCKQPTSYRKGRVLLAGDAAHIHSPLGGQGISVGFADALNLGWKLASIVRQERKLSACGASGIKKLDFGLLDTYHMERWPLGAAVLEWTHMQIATIMPGPHGHAARKLVQDFLDTKDGMNMLMGRSWGLPQRYELGINPRHKHPLVGYSAPDFVFEDGVRLGAKLEIGKGLLVDFSENEKLRELLVDGKHEDRVGYLSAQAQDARGLEAVLVRPDGIVTWLVEVGQEADEEALRTELGRWFTY